MKPVKISIISFGYKYGVPKDLNNVFDVRFIPNPYYIPALKNLSGENESVKEYVLKKPMTVEFIEKISGILDFLIPNYEKEGRAKISIGIGCTGGRHRSVAIANELCRQLEGMGHYVTVQHRDIEKDKREA